MVYKYLFESKRLDKLQIEFIISSKRYVIQYKWVLTFKLLFSPVLKFF
jgi:hypothetical protein